jgi:hypothetical protein
MTAESSGVILCVGTDDNLDVLAVASRLGVSVRHRTSAALAPGPDLRLVWLGDADTDAVAISRRFAPVPVLVSRARHVVAFVRGRPTAVWRTTAIAITALLGDPWSDEITARYRISDIEALPRDGAAQVDEPTAIIAASPVARYLDHAQRPDAGCHPAHAEDRCLCAVVVQPSQSACAVERAHVPAQPPSPRTTTAPSSCSVQRREPSSSGKHSQPLHPTGRGLQWK